MIAWLQRTLVLFSLAVALAWLWWCGPERPGLALAGLVLWLGGVAWVLALEFAWVGWVWRQSQRQVQPQPQPSAATEADERHAPGVAVLARAWWQEVGHALRVFAWWQPFRAQALHDFLPAPGTQLPGVVLVHGYLCNRGFWTPWMKALKARGIPFVAVTLEPPFTGIESHVMAVDAAVQQLRAATGRAPWLVGHSMGGLVVRAWWRSARAACAPDGKTDAMAAVGRIVTLGSPHHGTWMARFSNTDSGRQMQLDSPWLQTLAASEGPAERAQMECWHTPCDNIVYPWGTAVLSGAQARVVPDTGHVGLAFHPLVLRSVVERIAPAGRQD
jgi:triacylglycerol lipase